MGYADSTVKAVISMEFFMFNKIYNIQCTYDGGASDPCPWSRMEHCMRTHRR